MKIGITYDLKSDFDLPDDSLPDDYLEEFDSPITIDAIAAVLREMGHEPVFLGDGEGFLRRVLAERPELVFNIAEGHGTSRTRESRVPAVLEMLGIPYTGSDPLTLATTLDKDCARRLVASHGVKVPRGEVFRMDADIEEIRNWEALPYTMIVKPAWEGSSKGIRGKCVVDTPMELADALEQRRDQQQPLLAEEYIEGEELTVGVLGNDAARVIGILRVVPTQKKERFVYSLEVKRDYESHVRYELVENEIVAEAALQAYRALGCRDVSRIDFRMRGGVPYFLEVNPLPGLNPETSDLVILARLAGMSHQELIASILEEAILRVSESSILTNR
jgi:D-alanine-D-alanine ligase